MSTAPVEIAPHGDAYRVSRGGELLLQVPRELFDTYTQDCVFPPTWPDATEAAHPVRRLFWNPATRQFLMAGLERHPARVVEGHGHTGYRSFLQGLWLPQPPLLLLHPFWNPPDPYAPFDLGARAESLAVQLGFHHLLGQLRPPRAWTTILNATDAYLEALGITAADGSADPEAIHELVLMPPQALGRPPATRLLASFSQEHGKGMFPLLRNDTLCGLHTLGLGARLEAEAQLDAAGTDYRLGSAGPH